MTKHQLLIGVAMPLIVAGIGVMGGPSPGAPATSDVADSEESRLLGERMSAPFAPSLEMRENVDFIFTPVALVQECIVDDVILTYPNE